jgi:hypothetical protein
MVRMSVIRRIELPSATNMGFLARPPSERRGGKGMQKPRGTVATC